MVIKFVPVSKPKPKQFEPEEYKEGSRDKDPWSSNAKRHLMDMKLKCEFGLDWTGANPCHAM
jgi:hypothetical protein